MLEWDEPMRRWAALESPEAGESMAAVLHSAYAPSPLGSSSQHLGHALQGRPTVLWGYERRGVVAKSPAYRITTAGLEQTAPPSAANVEKPLGSDGVPKKTKRHRKGSTIREVGRLGTHSGGGLPSSGAVKGGGGRS